MFVTRRAFVGVGAAVGARYVAARGFTPLAGVPRRASAESAGTDARLASVDGRLDVELVAGDDWIDLADGRARLCCAASPRQVPQALGDMERLPAARARRSFVLSETMGMVRGRGMGMRFLINGREFDHMRIDDRVRLGDIEEWEYINNTDMDHPMHVHTNAFQRVGPDGQAEPAWLDGVVVPARGRARIRIRFTDFVGATVQHCHILDHEDLGMMSTMQVEG